MHRRAALAEDVPGAQDDEELDHGQEGYGIASVAGFDHGLEHRAGEHGRRQSRVERVDRAPCGGPCREVGAVGEEQRVDGDAAVDLRASGKSQNDVDGEILAAIDSFTRAL